MPTTVGSLLQKAHPGPAQVLSAPTHERYQTGLARTKATWWLFQHPSFKKWVSTYALPPPGTILLDGDLGVHQLPREVELDVVLSQNKAGQFQLLSQVARQLHLPLVSLEHTLPHPHWPRSVLRQMNAMRGHLNVFISEYSRQQWGFEDDALVVHHGVDTDLFHPGDRPRKTHLLSVVNDWKNRSWCCGFDFWREATSGLPVWVLGDTPGISRPARDVYELVEAYQEAAVFVNTSLVSPIPTALLEAMSCGCACVSTATCMVPEVVVHGENGLLARSPDEMRRHCRTLLEDPAMREELGRNARATVTKRFSMDQFVSRWDDVLDLARRIVPYARGVF